LVPGKQRAATRGADHGHAARLVRFTLLVVLGLTILWAWSWNRGALNFGIDLAIPLRAADRVVAGVSPYQASDFASAASLHPYLYPPPAALLLVPATSVPRLALEVAWAALLLAAALAALRVLDVPVIAWPFVLAWPPFLEPLMAGNVQILLFAAFVALFYQWPRRPRDLHDCAAPPWRAGLLAIAIPALKIGQPHAWLYLLGRRPTAALVGLLAIVAIALVTFPVVGASMWTGWFDQAHRAADPSWMLGGFALARLAPPVGLVVMLLSGAGALLYRGRHAGAVVGALTVIGAPSLYLSGTLMLVPALLLVRREVALVSAILIATSTYAGAWAGILLAGGALAGSYWWPEWLETNAALDEPQAPEN